MIPNYERLNCDPPVYNGQRQDKIRKFILALRNRMQMAKKKKKKTKRHQIEKYVAPQYTSYATLHSHKKSKHTDVCFLLISPHMLGWA